MINQIYNIECIDGMQTFVPDNSVDLVVTSPPYNINLAYDTWNDGLPLDEYWVFTNNWLKEVYRCLKPTGRIALNCLYEANFKDNGGRVFVMSEMWQIMKGLGFKWAGFVHLNEDKSHRVKHSAWGSYLKPSAPYIYNASECVLLAYKDTWKKVGSAEYKIDKDLFLECVQGEWTYRAVTKQLTKANFSEQIPDKAIQMLTYPGDLVMDPFSGSGTTVVSAYKLGRRYVGFEISKEYWNVSIRRMDTEVNKLCFIDSPDILW